jgi:hypothetical protein
VIRVVFELNEEYIEDLEEDLEWLMGQLRYKIKYSGFTLESTTITQES